MLGRDLQLVALDPRPHVICRPQPSQLRVEQRGPGIAIVAAMLDDDTHPAFLPSERCSMIPAPRCGARNPPSSRLATTTRLAEDQESGLVTARDASVSAKQMMAVVAVPFASFDDEGGVWTLSSAFDEHKSFFPVPLCEKTYVAQLYSSP
jgi:hypothetical protein